MKNRTKEEETSKQKVRQNECKEEYRRKGNMRERQKEYKEGMK